MMIGLRREIAPRPSLWCAHMTFSTSLRASVKQPRPTCDDHRRSNQGAEGMVDLGVLDATEEIRKAIVKRSILAFVNRFVRSRSVTVPRASRSGQWEGAQVLGMTQTQALRRVVVPQVFKRMLPDSRIGASSLPRIHRSPP
jgi:hypothetical protein